MQHMIREHSLPLILDWKFLDTILQFLDTSTDSIIDLFIV